MELPQTSLFACNASIRQIKEEKSYFIDLKIPVEITWICSVIG